MDTDFTFVSAAHCAYVTYVCFGLTLALPQRTITPMARQHSTQDRWTQLLSPEQQAAFELVHDSLMCENGTLANADEYDLIARAERAAQEFQE